MPLKNDTSNRKQSKTQIREVIGDEALEILFKMGGYAFHSSPPFREKEPWLELVRGRKAVQYFVLFEDEVPKAIAAGSPMTQQVRGKKYYMGGIWGVVTYPEARRKGYSRAVLGSLLESLRNSGKVFSCLYPFRESFYERLGYVSFPLPQLVKFSPSPLAPLLNLNLGGSVESVLTGEGLDTYLDYMQKFQARTHGAGLFDHINLIAVEKYPAWLALAKVNKKIEGVMLYKLEGNNPTEFKMNIFRFYTHTSEGRYLLLAWIARHIDQADQVEIMLPPFEHPEIWFTDLQVKIESVKRGPMGRVLDIAQLEGLHAGPGNFSAKISDPICPWNEGIWEFSTQNDLLQVRKGSSADCHLSIQGLAALVYGTQPPDAFRFRGWGTPSVSTQKIMGRMFPPQIPYLHENF